MKVALLGDVHANLPALEAVLDHAGRRGVAAIWMVGDWLGYGAFPNEVIALLRQHRALGIVGGYDLKVLEMGREVEKKPRKSEKWLSFRWSYENLSKENRKYLRALSREIRLNVEGKRILLTHASPASDEEYLTPATPVERLRELAGLADADVVICGHSHQPFARKVEGVWFINPGSVGRPDDGDPRASYAILQIQPRYFRVQHYRVAYDVERAAAAIRERGLPESFAQMVRQGRSLEAVQAAAEISEPALPLGESVPPAEPPAEEAARPAALQGADLALEAVRQLAQTYPAAVEHAEQVTRLALRLFDELQPLHGLGATERFWLHCAGLLHDIGWAEGWKGHHKTSLRLILDSPLLPFGTRERQIIGSVARYHRRALPAKKHAPYAALPAADRRAVSILAALLRVADGLDCTHQGVVVDLTGEVTPGEILIRCAVRGPAEEERWDALGKGDLLARVFGRKLKIEVTL